MIDLLNMQWIISIANGIVIFFLANKCIKNYNRKKKDKINSANKMVINHLRSYVVDNDLPPITIITSIKASIARKYNVRYDNLFTAKTLCEELIKEILGNSYISKYDQKKYIDMLNNYIKRDDILANDKNESSVNKFKLNEHALNLVESIISIAAGIITILGTSFLNIFK